MSSRFDSNKIAFTLINSLVDLNNETIPIFLRGSSTHVEQIINGDLRLKTIPAHHPALIPGEGSIVVEPAAKNEVTWNTEVEDSIWQKGSNVSISRQKQYGPDGARSARTITWSQGSGNTQLIRRELELEAGSDYYCSVICRRKDGNFRSLTDFIRMAGGVVGVPQTTIANINEGGKRWHVLSFPFSTAGGNPVIPEGNSDYYSVTAVSGATITLSALNNVRSRTLIGARLTISDVNKTYTITENTASGTNGTVTITVAETTLATDGVTTNSKAKLLNPAKQLCGFEIYAESTATIDFAGVQIQKGAFRTPIIYQQEDIKIRSGSTHYYLHSPIAGLSTFGVRLDLDYWAGDGNLIDLGQVRLWVEQGKLRAAVGSSQITVNEPLPTQASIFLQVASDRAALFLYVNGILKARIRQTYFVPQDSRMTLTTDGYRIIRQLFITDQIVQDRPDITVGEAADREMKSFLLDYSVDPATIASHTPAVKLPTVNVPGLLRPSKSIIDAVYPASNEIEVPDPDLFEVGFALSVYRDGLFITKSIVVSKSENRLLMETLNRINDGDTITQGESTPGRQIIRFPFEPIDPQVIQFIDVESKRIRVSSILSFKPGRAIVQTGGGEDVTQLLLQRTFPNTNELELDSLDGLEVGQIIAQPKNEQLIDPSLYEPIFTLPIEGLSIVEMAQDAIVVQNTGDGAVSTTILLKVFM